VSASGFEIRARLPLAHFALDVDVRSDARWLGVFGPSGSGKTSLLEAVAGWRRGARVSARVNGVPLADDGARALPPIEARGVGYVPQDALLFPHWSVRRNLEAGAARARERDPALLERTLDVLGIGHLLERSTTQLSGGERQRVALARAILSGPRVLLLDEPLGSLDRGLRRRILPYLLRVRDEFGLPTLFVSHDATEVQALCDEVVVLGSGRVEAQGPPAHVFSSTRGRERVVENVVAGVVIDLGVAGALLDLVDGGRAFVPSGGLSIGERVVFALGSEEILVALDRPTRISARNVLEADVVNVTPTAVGEARVDARIGGRGATLSVTLTQSSAQELELRAGLRVHLLFKTTACRVLSVPDSDGG
jgi:molybdate transport system ATP-binding protein